MNAHPYPPPPRQGYYQDPPVTAPPHYPPPPTQGYYQDAPVTAPPQQQTSPPSRSKTFFAACHAAMCCCDNLDSCY